MGRFLEGAEPSHPLADPRSFAERRLSQCESTGHAHRHCQGHVSNHLACLKTSGLVQTQATGRLIYYSLVASRVPPLLALGESIFSDLGAEVATCAVVAPVPGQSGHHRAPSAAVLHGNHAYGEMPPLKARAFARRDGKDSLWLALS